MEGNQMKMREVLEFVHDKLLTWNYTDKATAKMAVAIVDRCSKALSEPPRNCDVGKVEEQESRYERFCDSHKWVDDEGVNACSSDCPLYNTSECALHWAQLPYNQVRGK